MKNIDWHTKFMLTVIAILLFGILIKPSISPQKAEADPGEYVYVENSYKNPIPVEIVSGSVEVYSSSYSPLKVKIQDQPIWIEGSVEIE